MKPLDIASDIYLLSYSVMEDNERYSRIDIDLGKGKVFIMYIVTVHLLLPQWICGFHKSVK